MLCLLECSFLVTISAFFLRTKFFIELVTIRCTGVGEPICWLDVGPSSATQDQQQATIGDLWIRSVQVKLKQLLMMTSIFVFHFVMK